MVTEKTKHKVANSFSGQKVRMEQDTKSQLTRKLPYLGNLADLFFLTEYQLISFLEIPQLSLMAFMLLTELPNGNQRDLTDHHHSTPRMTIPTWPMMKKLKNGLFSEMESNTIRK